jgi:two-component system, chemotaxis family, chemotaxis protein CheY
MLNKLLIVDDHVPTRNWLRNELAASASQILESGDGADAVQIYAKERPDWVLMDIEMQPMNGLTAARKIRKEFPEAQIIMVSNHQLRESALNAGASEFVSKEDLWKLRQILGRSAP